jgi:hypothetical protein
MPIPSNNTYVAVEGFLNRVELGTGGWPMLFHVNVDNINFLGRAVLPQSSPDGAQGMSQSIFTHFHELIHSQTRLHLLLGHRGSGTALKRPRLHRAWASPPIPCHRSRTRRHRQPPHSHLCLQLLHQRKGRQGDRNAAGICKYMLSFTKKICVIV